MTATIMSLMVRAMLALAVARTATGAGEFQHDTFLDTNRLVQLEWTPQNDGITFRLQVTAQVERPGYISMGISRNGSMAGADMAIAMLNANGNVTLIDAYAEKKTQPLVDEPQNLQLINSKVDGERVQVTFKRSDSQDPRDVTVTPTTHVIWAFGSLDATGQIPAYHSSNRGSKQTNLNRLDDTPL